VPSRPSSIATSAGAPVGAGHVFRQARLDADDDITMAGDRSLRQGHIGPVHIVQLATGRDNAGACDIDERAADLGASSRHRGDLIDIVGAGRAGIDPAGHPVLQEQLRPFLAAAGMRVNVYQARYNDLATHIDSLSATSPAAR
jgi:hypothetical protein